MERGLEPFEERLMADPGDCCRVLEERVEPAGRGSVTGQGALGVPACGLGGVCGRQRGDCARVTGPGLLGGHLRTQLPGRGLLLEGDEGSAGPVVRPVDPLPGHRIAEQRLQPGVRDVPAEGGAEQGPDGHGNEAVLGQRQRIKGGRQVRILVRLREGGHAFEAPLQGQMPSAQLVGPARGIVDFDQQAHPQPARMERDQRPCHPFDHTLRFARGAQSARPLRVREHDHGVALDPADHGGDVALEGLQGGDAKGHRHLPGHLLR